MELLTYLIAGAIAGALAGLLGIGGGLVIVPVPGGTDAPGRRFLAGGQIRDAISSLLFDVFEILVSLFHPVGAI